MSSIAPRQEAIAIARAKLALRPVYIDTETTGLDAGAEIVEICVLDHDGQPLVHTLVKPRNRIPLAAERVHGITNDMVARSPTWRDIWGDVAAAVAGRQAAIYNADFDVRMMQQSSAIRRLRWSLPGTEFFCVMRLYSQFRGQFRWQRLSEAGRQCRIKIPNAHRAHADALLARAVLEYLGSQGA